MNRKIPYICGPLTELSADLRAEVKDLYTALGDICQEVLGARAFVPHENYDPIRHAHYTPQEIDQVERVQVCEKTSVLIVVAVEPSWGAGIEVEMANRSDVPVIVFKDASRKLSRLLLGNPGVREVIEYAELDEIKDLLRQALARLKQQAA